MAPRGDGVFYKTGIILAVMIVLVIVGGFALPSTFSVQRSVEVEAPAGQVYEHLTDYQKWAEWDPWLAKDNSLQSRAEGPAGVGQKLIWSSGGQMTGQCEIIEAEPPNRLVMDITFRNSESPHRTQFLLTHDGAKTKVVWTLTGENGMQPIGNYFGLMMDSFVGGMFNHGLKRLKSLVETGEAGPPKKPAADG